MRKYHNQFAKQICNITVKKPVQKLNQKIAKQTGKNANYSQHQPRIHTEPSPKNSLSEEQFEGFYSFLEINQIQETEEDENINLNLNSQDLQQKLSVSFYAKEERGKSQFELLDSCNPIYKPLMCKSKQIAPMAFQQFFANSNQEYYLLNNANSQLFKTSSAKTCNQKNSNQQTSATTTLGKSSCQNISTSKFEKNTGKKEKKQVLNLKTNKQSEKNQQHCIQLKKPKQNKTARKLTNYLAKFTQNMPETYMLNSQKAVEKQEIHVNQKTKNLNKEFSYLRTPKYHFYGREKQVGISNQSKEKASPIKL